MDWIRLETSGTYLSSKLNYQELISGRLKNTGFLLGKTDTPTGILPEGSARCVQSFDDSLDFAIRMTYRISLRSSSLWEPRHPLLKVLVVFFKAVKLCILNSVHLDFSPSSLTWNYEMV
jgi:hypothetical protein